MKKRLLALLSIITFCASTKAQLFSQNFSSSTTVGDYFSATPNSGQFTNISASGTSTVTATTGTLKVNKVASGAVAIYRNFDFTTQPTFVQLKFDIEVSGATTNANFASFFIGSGFTTTNTANTSNFATRIVINATAASEFRVNVVDVTGSVYPSTTTAFSGVQNITMVANNSGSSRSYTGPDASTQNIATGTIDVWVGTTLFGNDLALKNTASPASDITGFKIQPLTSATGTIDIDNISFRDLLGNAVLPVTLTSFTGQSTFNQVQLNWETATEINSKHFEVLKSTNGTEFSTIGIVASKGDVNKKTDYQFYDKSPNTGTNYYQLKQVDNDGKYSFHKIIAIEHKAISGSNIKLLSTAANEIKLAIYVPTATHGFLKLIDMSGKTMYQASNNFKEGINTINISTINDANKLYIAQFITAKEVINLKLFKN